MKVIETIKWVVGVVLLVSFVAICTFIMMDYNPQKLFDFLVSGILPVSAATFIAILIYQVEFSDESNRTITREMMMIESVLAELNELVMNTCENIDACGNPDKTKKSNKKIHSLFKHSNSSQLAALARITREDLGIDSKKSNFGKEKDLKVVANTYFTSSLDNYIHNARHTKSKIVRFAHRIKKMAELINNNKSDGKQIGAIIWWTKELNVYIFGFVRNISKLKLKNNCTLEKIAECEFLIKLKSEFWANRNDIKTTDSGLMRNYEMIEKMNYY